MPGAVNRRVRRERGGRAAGFVLALLVEALLVFVVVTLGSSIGRRDEPKSSVSVVRLKAAAQSAEQSAREQARPKFQRAEQARAAPVERAPAAMPEVAPRPQPPAQPLIVLSRSELAIADIAALPRAAPPSVSAKRSSMGPPDTGFAAARDTPRVGGSGPNGEPLYAASWYREPYDDELSGYLSTASGPGWGLIACRTAPDYRVEDCVQIDEYPTGSNIARAAAAAAWQFKVRPPRLGGQPRIGEWVRIRIDYDYRRK